MTKIRKVELNGGYTIERTLADVILSITNSTGNTIKLNDTVVANGRIFVPKGMEGRLVQIDEPSFGHSDVLWCDFGDNGCHSLKFKDLEFKNGTYVVPPQISE